MTPCQAQSWFSQTWYRPMPKERLATLRIAIVFFSLVALLVQFRKYSAYASFSPQQFQPVGVVRILAAPLPAGWMLVCLILTLGLGCLALIGWRYILTGPLYALAVLWVTSYQHSWGQIFHTDNLLVIHLLILAVAPAADAYSMQRVRRSSTGAHGWPVRLMCLVTVLVYAVSGIAKLRNSGLAWIEPDILRNHIAMDNLRKIELGDIHSPLAPWLLKYRPLFGVMAAFTLVVELGSPAALFHRKVAAAWVVMAWMFHVGILALMAIVFPYFLSGVAYASFFRCERLVEWVRARVHHRRSRGPAEEGAA